MRINNDFRDKAPLSAAEAATIILDGVRSGTWRILVGEDALAAASASCRPPRRCPLRGRWRDAVHAAVRGDPGDARSSCPVGWSSHAAALVQPRDPSRQWLIRPHAHVIGVTVAMPIQPRAGFRSDSRSRTGPGGGPGGC